MDINDLLEVISEEFGSRLEKDDLDLIECTFTN